MRICLIRDLGRPIAGGDRTVLAMVDALLEAKHNLVWATSDPKGIVRAAEAFGKGCVLERSNIEIVRCRMASFIPHPYSVAYIAKEVREKYDAFLVTDDIPKSLSGKVISYVHYPHSARIVLNSLIEYEYRKSVNGRLKWFVHKLLFPKFFYTHEISDRIMLIANSTLTKSHILKVLKPKFMQVLYPPIKSKHIYGIFKKEGKSIKGDSAVFIGRVIPEKNIEDIIYVARLIKDRIKLKFKIIGFLEDKAFLEYLIRVVKGLRLRNVQFMINASREKVIDMLLRAKFIIHPAQYEPFGASVVEGMAAGCVPIVKRGVNGPWMDITQKGLYGFGYDTPRELAMILTELIKEYDSLKLDKITDRALNFEEEHFKRSFVGIVNSFLLEAQ